MNDKEEPVEGLLTDEEIAELKEQIEYMHEAWEVLIEVTEAECQERIEGILNDIRVFNNKLLRTELGDKTFRQLVTGRWYQDLKEGAK